MSQLMQHPNHGLHHALNKQEQIEMEKTGWIAIDVHPAESKRLLTEKSKQSLTEAVTIPPQESEQRKPGRPPKLSSLGGNYEHSPASNKQKP